MSLFFSRETLVGDLLIVSVVAALLSVSVLSLDPTFVHFWIGL